MNKNPKSTCCNAPMTVSTADEGTACYVCSKCNRPADIRDNRENATHTPDCHLTKHERPFKMCKGACGCDCPDNQMPSAPASDRKNQARDHMADELYRTEMKSVFPPLELKGEDGVKKVDGPSFRARPSTPASEGEKVETSSVRCKKCGAETVFKTNGVIVNDKMQHFADCPSATPPIPGEREVVQNIAEEICRFTEYGQPLHPNDIRHFISQAFTAGKKAGSANACGSCKQTGRQEIIKVVEYTIAEFGDQGIDCVAGILQESFHGQREVEY